MKKALLVALSLSLQAGLALASTDPEAVPRIDAAREGDLAQKVAEFYASTKPKGCDGDYGKTTFAAYKLSSGSAMDEKKLNSTLTYEATYLAVSVCNTGSTYSGAYQDVAAAAVIQATRSGKVYDGGSPLKATKPDTFKVIRAIDPATLSSSQQ